MIRTIPRFLTIPSLLATLLLALAASNTVQAESVIGKPIYNSDTKSYFELIDAGYMNHGQGPNWQEARELAEKKYLGKSQGRLAVIPSAKVEMYVRLNLRPYTNTWIGLYYDCASKNLMWVDGRTLRPGEYTNWAPSGWYGGHEGMFCHSNFAQQMPVFLALGHTERHWMIQLPPKRWHMLLVEYPTGGTLSGENNKSMTAPDDGKPATNPTPEASKKPEAPKEIPAAKAETAPPPSTKPLAEVKSGPLPPGAGLPAFDGSVNP